MRRDDREKESLTMNEQKFDKRRREKRSQIADVAKANRNHAEQRMFNDIWGQIRL